DAKFIKTPENLFRDGSLLFQQVDMYTEGVA
nr:glutathione transferase (EC 2.5.1.18) class alpha 6b - pig (fragments) [Sus scrofa domesticus]